MKPNHLPWKRRSATPRIGGIERYRRKGYWSPENSWAMLPNHAIGYHKLAKETK